MRSFPHPILLVACALISLAGCHRGDTDDANAGFVFHQTEKKLVYAEFTPYYKFVPPDGWQFGSETKGGISITGSAQSNADSAIATRQFAISQTRPLSLDKQLKRAVVTMSGQFAKSREREFGRLRFHGVPAVFAIYSVETEKGTPHIIDIVITQHKGMQYYITGVFPGRNWSEHLPMFRKVLSSWRWLKPESKPG